MPPVAEYHVADDQQAPFVADHFEREIDRAAGALIVGHVMCSPCGEGMGRGGSHKHRTRETPTPNPRERASLVSTPQGGEEQMTVAKGTGGSTNRHSSRDDGGENR